jgi:hypothetical protein
MLIERGANANFWEGKSGNALQAALVGGHMKVAEMLIRRRGGNADHARRAMSMHRERSMAMRCRRHQSKATARWKEMLIENGVCGD